MNGHIAANSLIFFFTVLPTLSGCFLQLIFLCPFLNSFFQTMKGLTGFDTWYFSTAYFTLQIVTSQCSWESSQLNSNQSRQIATIKNQIVCRANSHSDNKASNLPLFPSFLCLLISPPIPQFSFFSPLHSVPSFACISSRLHPPYFQSSSLLLQSSTP